jgi:hypothetical protein
LLACLLSVLEVSLRSLAADLREAQSIHQE